MVKSYGQLISAGLQSDLRTRTTILKILEAFQTDPEFLTSFLSTLKELKQKGVPLPKQDSGIFEVVAEDHLNKLNKLIAEGKKLQSKEELIKEAQKRFAPSKNEKPKQ